MTSLVRIIREIHRRSLWQVLAVYLAGSWVAIQVVNQLTQTAGLPDWVPPFALVLLVLGLPVVLATALVQEGVAAPRDSRGPEAGAASDARPGPVDRPASDARSSTVETSAPRSSGAGTAAPAFALSGLLTWRRAILAGLLAFGILGASVAGYFAMRAGGFGPAASLVAQGVIEEGEPVVLADFRNATPDPHLGSVVSEALRIDLSESSALRVVERNQIQGALRRMERDEDSPLTADLAREVAVREGISAYLEGEVARAGTGFILSATLRSADEGVALASFRRTARDEAGVIEAIDRLSQDVRERAGESLRSIRRTGALYQVTTSSLDALRLYSEAERLAAVGLEREALALLDEAVELDPEFSMAWRKIAALNENLGTDPARVRFAVTEAHRLRDRLTTVERAMAEAYYATVIENDLEEAVRAYERVLRVDPDHPGALNNLGIRYHDLGQLERADEVLARAAHLPEPSGVALLNYVRSRLALGDVEGARAAAIRFSDLTPDDPRTWLTSGWVHARSLDLDAARADALAFMSAAGPPVHVNAATELLVAITIAAGRPLEALEIVGVALADPDLAPETRALVAQVAGWIHGRLLRDPDAADALTLRQIALLGDDADHDVAYLSLMTAELHLQSGWPGNAARWLDSVDESIPLERHVMGGPHPIELLRLWHASSDPDSVVEAFREYAAGPRCMRCVDGIMPVLLDLAGQPAAALAAWRELVDSPLPDLAYGTVMIPIALEESGRLAMELGDRDAALEAYRLLLRLWGSADAAMQPRVAEIRERVAELEATAIGG